MCTRSAPGDGGTPATPPAPSPAPTARAFDAVLCDLDNVVRFYDTAPLAALERAAGLPEGTTTDIAYAPEVDLPLLLGRITPAAWVEAIAAGLTERVGAERARVLGRALADAPFRADDEVVSLLRRARTHVPLVLVTNATLQLDADLALLGLTDLADAVVSSAVEQVAKPDPAIYRIAADRAGVPLARCLFVDDRQENVDAAVALGMTGVLYREPADLRRALGPCAEDEGERGGGGRGAAAPRAGASGPREGDPEVLFGGLANAGAVLRRGDAVERPAPPHAVHLHAHLRALREQGFDGVPVPLGLSASGRRERLSYVPGEVAVDPHPPWTWTDDVLRSVGALLRRMHDAAAAVPPGGAAGWPTDLADPEGAAAPGAVVCHNDVCPENVVFRDGRAAALIDFDLAAPGRPVWDVAMTARYWAPMRGRDGLDPSHRLRVLADGYGLGRADRAALPRVIEQATAVCRAFVERRVERGDAAYTAAYEESGRAVWDRHQTWLADHRGALTAALLTD